jgi:BCD family chlorophyll transporter-like MFS transporter
MTWLGIFRLGLVQAALGGIVVLTTSTMNRVMVVELGFPALLPGALVALHYAIQVLRPRMGFGSDMGGRCTPWIIGGMAVLACGGIGAASAVALMSSNAPAGILLAVVAFALVGLGVGASGTSLLVLLSKQVAPHRRGAAATVVWVMMIAGIALTATFAGKWLDPFSPGRLLAVTSAVAGIAMLLTCVAVFRVEVVAGEKRPETAEKFLQALAQVWEEPQSRRFAIFVFVSMFAYSAQELIIEPFAGAVFHLTPGASTGLAGLQHSGVLAGMLLVAIATSTLGGSRLGAMRTWTVGGCVGSALAVLAVAGCAFGGPLRPALFILGVANGTFAVSAIGAMMGLAQNGRAAREGTRMGLWGAAQAVAFGCGGLAGSFSSDVARAVFGTPNVAYSAVFVAEAALFVMAAIQAAKVFSQNPPPATLLRAEVPVPHGG